MSPNYATIDRVLLIILFGSIEGLLYLTTLVVGGLVSVTTYQASIKFTLYPLPLVPSPLLPPPLEFNTCN